MTIALLNKNMTSTQHHTYPSKYSVFIIEFRAGCKGEEEVRCVIIGHTTVGHGNQTSAHKSDARVEFILNGKC